MLETSGSDSSPPLSERSKVRRVVSASALGGILEWYDFAIYGFFAVTISQKFFPSDDPVASLLAVYGVFAIGSLTRPLGGLVFGYIGDRLGRRRALILSVIAMGTGTTLIAVLPTYQQIGVWAPVLLTLLRMAQGLAVGGEYTGASVYVAEHAPARRRGFLASIVEAATDVGFLLGSGIGALTATLAGEVIMQAWGWRVPFALGGALALLTLLLRRRLPESPAAASIDLSRSPVLVVFRDHWRSLVHLGSLILFGSISFFIVFVYGTSFIEQDLKVSTAFTLDMSTFSLVLLLLAALLAGFLSDRIGRKSIFLGVALAGLCLSWPLFWLIHQDSLPLILLGEVGSAVIIGAAFGVLPATMAELLPPEVRCSGAGIGYNTCLGVFGGTAPMIATFLVEQSDDPLAPAFYLMAAAALQLIGVLKLREHALKPLPLS